MGQSRRDMCGLSTAARTWAAKRGHGGGARGAVERARRGEGPAFLECMTYRYYGHHVGDISRTYYRSKEEEQEWRDQRDPLKILAGKLVAGKLTDESVLDRIRADVRSEVERGVQFAIEAPYPDPSEVDQDVYA